MPKFKIELCKNKIAYQFSKPFIIEASTRRTALIKANKIAANIAKEQYYPDLVEMNNQQQYIDWDEWCNDTSIECRPALIEEILDNE